ncbi:uncharacterized protein LOC111308071 [Durio zibethinus]|uniref:Uncharacterized protein LOC111308071 n=1 Tax=Durio zibethinus TaxID=66656 RepID=A0A6P6AB78_DURZI|nr:uncharacterized protein LOC111308071 [Durio zibethinus]
MQKYIVMTVNVWLARNNRHAQQFRVFAQFWKSKAYPSFSTTAKGEREKDSPPAAGSGPPKFNFSLWAKCLLASVLSFLPFWKEKWAKLKRIQGESELVVVQVENVAGVVEKVATAAEKVSAQVTEKLPDDSKLQKAAVVVEHVSEKNSPRCSRHNIISSTRKIIKTSEQLLCKTQWLNQHKYMNSFSKILIEDEMSNMQLLLEAIKHDVDGLE